MPRKNKTEHTREASLLARARQGEERAFRALVEPLRDRIYWRAVGALGDRDDADDVTQETLLRAFTRLDTFRGDARFSSWLYQVASNCIRMHLRKQRRHGAQRLDDHLLAVERIEGPVTLGEQPWAPDRTVTTNELVNALGEAISNLPPHYGSILRLWFEDGLDLKQIHERSGLSIPAIKSRLFRARKRVRAEIESTFGSGALVAA